MKSFEHSNVLLLVGSLAFAFITHLISQDVAEHGGDLRLILARNSSFSRIQRHDNALGFRSIEAGDLRQYGSSGNFNLAAGRTPIANSELIGDNPWSHLGIPANIDDLSFDFDKADFDEDSEEAGFDEDSEEAGLDEDSEEPPEWVPPQVPQQRARVVSYDIRDLAPAFENAEDYPPGWLMYHPVHGVITRERFLELERGESVTHMDTRSGNDDDSLPDSEEAEDVTRSSEDAAPPSERPMQGKSTGAIQ